MRNFRDRLTSRYFGSLKFNGIYLNYGDFRGSLPTGPRFPTDNDADGRNFMELGPTRRRAGGFGFDGYARLVANALGGIG